MIKPVEITELYKLTVETWGPKTQLDMVIEEAVEVIHACMKLKRAIKKCPEKGWQGEEANQVAEEAVDSLITLGQMQYILGNGDQAQYEFWDRVMDNFYTEKVAKLMVKLGADL